MKKGLLLLGVVLLVCIFPIIIGENRFLWFACFLFLLFLIFSIGINRLVKYTSLYRNIFAHTTSLFPKYSEQQESVRKYQVVSLGSNNALFSFHFQDIIGANWSTGLQTTRENFSILKKYHLRLTNGGIVIFVLAPFGTILKTTDFDRWHKAKYYKILPEILSYKEKLFVRYPLFLDFKFSIKALLGAVLGCIEKDCRTDVDFQRLDKCQLEIDAKIWVDAWKKQFGISDLNAPLSICNNDKQCIVIELYKEMFDFVIQQGYKPVFVMPPVTQELAAYFPNIFFENYIYPFTNSFSDIPFLNYFNDPEFKKPDLYLNSFFLNLKGRKEFTNRVLKDLNLVE